MEQSRVNRLDKLIRTVIREQLKETLIKGTLTEKNGDIMNAERAAWHKLEDTADIIIAKVKREAW